MSLDSLTDALKGWLDKILHVDWLSTAVTMVVVLIITALIAHLVTRFIKKILHVDKNPLPASSIFVNIGRAIVWIVGVCVVLSSCFNVNISAAITALGIGGLAVSLGFQATLSNLIAGLQVSLTKLVAPGDHINVGGNEGVVDDVTWRHTRIITPRGERVVIPNSLMNTDALIKLAPMNIVRVNILIPTDTFSAPGAPGMDKLISDMESQIDDAVGKITKMEDKAKIQLIEMTERGYRGLLTFTVMEGANVGEARTCALKAISDHASAISRNRKRRHKVKHVKVPHRVMDFIRSRRKR
ncbi:MAG: mechanosensitive ion channel [Eggerthellaceae bacterium]|nr:mechanosensitive ion channel [Eggerthellaceae bacterium]